MNINGMNVYLYYPHGASGNLLISGIIVQLYNHDHNYTSNYFSKQIYFTALYFQEACNVWQLLE